MSKDEYVNHFIKIYYNELNKTFRSVENKINSKGISSLDKLNDTILALYNKAYLFDTYEEFEKFAIKKFILK